MKGGLLFTEIRAAICLKVSVLVLLTVAFADSAQARRYFYRANESDTPVPYYGKELYDSVKSGARDKNLQELLFTILNSGHVAKQGDFDEIVSSCNGTRSCYQHNSLGYDVARQVLLGRLHLQQNGGNYSITDVYCETAYNSNDFPRNRGPGPDRIPDSTVLNTEHTWPQSRFTNKFPNGMQKSDLHHLFPSDSATNNVRGNFEFGEVDAPARPVPCGSGKFGKIKSAPGYYFEPPAAHRGNVARALFYFSTRYRLSISKVEEYFIRKWHVEDPVDEFEMARNNEIHKIQGDRNPFIDHPELVNYISDF